MNYERLGVNCCCIASSVWLNGFNMSPCLLWFQCLCCSRLTACSERGIHWRFCQQKEGRRCAGERGNWEQVWELLQLLSLLWYDKLRSAQTFPSTARPQQISQHFYEEPCAEILMSHKSYHDHMDLFNNLWYYPLLWLRDINSALIVGKKIKKKIITWDFLLT